MGCCDSKSAVPDVIIPDPEPGEKCKVLFKKNGMMSRDQNVFKDGDKSQKWLMLDKEGSFWKNPTYMLENFVRDDKGNGKVLCAAKLIVTEAKTYGHKSKEDSDSSESDSSDSESTKEIIVTKMKWAQEIKVKFYSDREMNDQIAEVKVKAKGKAKKTVETTTTEVEDKDDEGNVTGTHEEENVKTDIEKKVKKVKYTIKSIKGEDEPPKIKLKGKPNKAAYKLEWEGDVFQAEIDSSFWGSEEIEVKTSWKNSGLGMLMGYVIAKEISPDDIKDRVSVF